MTTTTAKKKKEEGSEEEKRRRKEKEEKEREEEKEEEEEEALEELLVGVHDQVYGKKHLIDKSILRKRRRGRVAYFHSHSKSWRDFGRGNGRQRRRGLEVVTAETNGASNEAARPYSAPGVGRRKSGRFSFAAKGGKREDVFRKFIHDGEESVFESRERVFLVPLRKYPKEYELLQSSTDNWQTYVNEGKVYYYNEVLNRRRLMNQNLRGCPAKSLAYG